MGLSRHIMKKKFLNSLYLRNMFWQVAKL
jgi:hypothetical protein